MTLSRRTFSKLAGVSALGSALISTYDGAFAQDTERPVLKLATNAADAFNLDPHFATTTQDRTIVDMLFTALVRFSPGDSTSFEPDLAREMPTSVVNDDGTQTWSFTLRDDIATHATPELESYILTVEDVVYSLQKSASAESSAYSGDYEGWIFETGDKATVTITLQEPISETLFLPRVANYSGGYIISQKAYEAGGADGFLDHPVGTGPFAFESRTPQANVMLVAHDAFYRGEPRLGGVDVRFIADTTSRELALQSGDVDVIYGLPEAVWVDRINEIDGITGDVFGVGEVALFSFSVEHEILKDPLVREAIMLSISRDEHLALQGEPVGMPIYSVVPYDLMPGGLSREEAAEAGVLYEQDLDRARELLTEAGYPDGFELSLVSSEQEAYLTQYEVMAEELRQVGINVKLEVVQHAAMHELIREGRNAIVIYKAYRPTADTYLTQFFSTDGGSTNFSHFTVDELRDQARAELDTDKQDEIWKHANIEILQNFAGTGLLYTNLTYARRDIVDYGHELRSVPALYPGIDETTNMDGAG